MELALHRVVPSLAVLIGSVIATQNLARAEEYQGTMAQQMACTPDVFRLCGSQIPDVNRIVGCLRQNTAQLSAPCRAVFESHASIPQPSQQAAPGRRETPAGNDDQ
jgi:hypothetical protein